MPGVHEHTARESITRHSELAPQGEGTQGLNGAGVSTLGAKTDKFQINVKTYLNYNKKN